MILDIIIVLLLIVLNGFFAMAEMAMVSARKVRLKSMARQGSRMADAALALAEHPSTFLSTVQIGITLIGVLAGAYSGTTLAEPFAVWLIAQGVPAENAGHISIGLVVAGITYLSLVIGELVPKQIALRHAEFIACITAYPLALISKVAKPLVILLDVSNRALLTLLCIRQKKEDSVSEEDVKAMIAEGTESGVFLQAEQEMISGVMRFADKSVQAFITPRTDVVWLDVRDRWENIRDTIKDSPFSRFPVCDGEVDNILGVVHSKDILNQIIHGQSFDLRDLLAPAPFVPDTSRALDVLEIIKQSPVHLALVVDEYGSFEGIVTSTDIMAAIVGELREGAKEEEPEAREREDGSWLMDGSIAIDKMKDLLELSAPLPDEDQYRSLAGFVLSQLREIPMAGDHFTYENYRFEVMDMDGRRVDKVLVFAVPEAL